MQVSVGYSDCPDSAEAGRLAAQMALDKVDRNEPCDLVLLFCTARHNQQSLRDSVAKVLGNTRQIFGGGAAGVITNEYYGYAGDQAAVACMWLDESSCTVLTEKGLLLGEEKTGERLGKRLLEAGLKPHIPAILFYDAIDRSHGDVRLILATWLLQGLEKGMGFLPNFMGAGLQGDHSSTATKQYTGSGLEESCAIAMSFSQDICIDSIIMHGCRPASPYYTVTKADGAVILEINGRPALDFMDEVLESSISPEDYPFFLLFGLNHADRWGEYDESNYASRLCLGIDKERGGIVMFEPDMVEGMNFQIMFRSLDLKYMKPKIDSLFAKLNGREPLFALYIDCAGRCAGYSGVDVEDAIVIQKAVGDSVPLLGIYTGAEIAPMGGKSRGLDLTGVFCLFSKSKGTENESADNKPQEIWNSSAMFDKEEDVPIDAALRLCERNAAKVLAIDSKSIAIRHELEQKRRGFSLLAELAVSLREGGSEEDMFLSVTQRINSALNMQKTAVLFPGKNGEFIPYVLQGYNEEEKAALEGLPVEISPQLLNAEEPVLLTAADSPERLQGLRNALGLPYLIAAPVVVKNEIAAILVTGRMVEAQPFLSRLGRSDVETVQAISALLASVLVYKQLDDANRQAQSDGLTGLLNRGALEQQVAKLLDNQVNKRKFAFLIIDCDYFKEVNDSYGHMQGDEVLTALGQFLHSCFRAEDCVARIGGDEFAVFCTLTEDDEKIISRAQRLVEGWNATSFRAKNGKRFRSSISVGIACAPRDGNTYDELFHKADLALYKSKQLGRNRYSLYSSSRSRNSEK